MWMKKMRLNFFLLNIVNQPLIIIDPIQVTDCYNQGYGLKFQFSVNLQSVSSQQGLHIA